MATTTYKTRSYGVPGAYSVVDWHGEDTGVTIDRCSWGNADTTGRNSVRPLWVVTDERRDKTISMTSTLREAKEAAFLYLAAEG